MILIFLSSHRPGRHTLRAGALALTVVSLAAMNQAPPTRVDDEHDAAANTTAEAEVTVNTLQPQLEGIDASLAQMFIDLQALNGQIPMAQAAYGSATATYDQKTHEHAAIMDELSAIQDEQNRIDRLLNQTTTQAGDTQRAIADLVRHKYREDNVDPVAIALTADGTESITNRTATTDMTLRTESQTVTTALDVSSSQRTQATRQNATTGRITGLEVEAARAREGVKQTKNGTDAKLTELNSLKEQAQAGQAEWDAQKGRVEVFLGQAEAGHQTRSAELAAIDATNCTSGASYVSASGFRNPLNIPIIVTSPFGMRCHPMLGVMKSHSGIDIAADCGTVIRAVASDYMNAVSSDVSTDNYVDISHDLVGGSSVITEYLHMQAQYVSPGQYVSTGDALGEVGSTGYATDCRLHFGVLQNGGYVEPMDYL